MTMTYEQLTIDGSPVRPSPQRPPSPCPTCHGTGSVSAEVHAALTAPVPSAGARTADPATSRQSGQRVRSDDVQRFSSRSRQGKLLDVFAKHPSTDYEAAAKVLSGTEYSISSFEGTRRRCSDLRRAGYIHDTGLRRHNAGSPDESIVWSVTGRGMIALRTLHDTGWSIR